VGHVSRSSGLLHVKASQAMVSQFALKLADERRRVVHVTSSRRLREDKVKNGRIDAMSCIGLFYPYFTVFIVLCPMSILVCWIGI
jgi:hypothetical protein